MRLKSLLVAATLALSGCLAIFGIRGDEKRVSGFTVTLVEQPALHVQIHAYQTLKSP